MKILSRLQVGTKLALVMTFILALVCLGIYLYFPPRLENQAIDALTQRASAVTDVAAFGIAPGLQNRNPVAVAAAVTAFRRNPDLVFFVVRDHSGQVFASFNEMVAASAGSFFMTPQNRSSHQPVITGMTAGEQSETTGAFSGDRSMYQTTTPVRYRGRDIGRLLIGFSFERVLAQTSRSRATVALVTLLAFAVGVMAVFALSTLITVPLHRIVKIAERIAAGEVHSRADVQGTDEVGKLARSFNLMLDHLSSAREEL